MPYATARHARPNVFGLSKQEKKEKYYRCRAEAHAQGKKAFPHPQAHILSYDPYTGKPTAKACKTAFEAWLRKDPKAAKAAAKKYKKDLKSELAQAQAQVAAHAEKVGVKQDKINKLRARLKKKRDAAKKRKGRKQSRKEARAAKAAPITSEELLVATPEDIDLFADDMIEAELAELDAPVSEGINPMLIAGAIGGLGLLWFLSGR